MITELKRLRAENERLKAVISCECDNMAAYVPFDELGNKAMFVYRMFNSVGDIIPELKELVKEIGPQIRTAQVEMQKLVFGS